MLDKTLHNFLNTTDEQGIEFVIASNKELLNQAYKIRYKSYSQRNVTNEKQDERFQDEFDEQANATNFLALYKDEVIGSIRTVISRNNIENLPCNASFSDVLSQPRFSQSAILEVGRFCILEEYQRELGMNSFLPFYRITGWVSYVNNVDFVVAALANHHRYLYEKLLQFECLSDVRSYPGVTVKGVLMCTEWRQFMENMLNNQPDLFNFFFKDNIGLKCII